MEGFKQATFFFIYNGPGLHVTGHFMRHHDHLPKEKNIRKIIIHIGNKKVKASPFWQSVVAYIMILLVKSLYVKGISLAGGDD